MDYCDTLSYPVRGAVTALSEEPWNGEKLQHFGQRYGFTSFHWAVTVRVAFVFEGGLHVVSRLIRFSMGVSYDYLMQDSEQEDDSYDEHRVVVSLSMEMDVFNWQ